jgi:Dipeptidyl aminopeptidases/acylaminoacyl-peptidases
MTLISEEVTWDVDGISVRGTLTRPVGMGPHPGIVFVAGSGPTDRDWCSPLLSGTNCSGRLMAEALTREGFMTLRYDKRASGPHAQENARRLVGRISMQSHLDELIGAIDTLRSDGDVDPARLFVLTSSEGAIHALHYQLQATDRRFAGLVLTGAPGRSIGQVARSQILAQTANLENGDLLMNEYDAAIAAFMADEPVTPDPSLPEGMRGLLLSLTAPVNLPFSRELWSSDPAALIAKVTEPVLVVIGKKDIQADWQADGGALESAAARGGNVTFAYPPDADHVLKHEEKPRDALVAADVGARYNSEGRGLDPEALGVIVDWLSGQGRR